jgi:integral membrane protein
MNSLVNIFRRVALIEGISYVVLLGIAMPLKYFFDSPLAVKIVGWAHGALFIAYLFFLLFCWIKYKWTFLRVVSYFFASLLPFLPFLVERNLKKEYVTAR